MAKKKKSEDFASKNIVFNLDNLERKLLKYHPSTREVEIKTQGEKGVQRIPFAHVPKEIKEIIRPL